MNKQMSNSNPLYFNKEVNLIIHSLKQDQSMDIQVEVKGLSVSMATDGDESEEISHKTTESHSGSEQQELSEQGEDDIEVPLL